MRTKMFFLGQSAMWIALSHVALPSALSAEADPTAKGIKNTRAGQAIASAAREFGDRAASAMDAMVLRARETYAGVAAGARATGGATPACGMATAAVIAEGAVMAYETSPVGLIKASTASKALKIFFDNENVFFWGMLGVASYGTVPIGVTGGILALTPEGSLLVRPLASLGSQTRILADGSVRPEFSVKRELGYTVAAGAMGGGIDILADLAWQGASKIWNGDRSKHEWGLTERGYGLFRALAPFVYSKELSCADKIKAIGKEVKAAVAAVHAQSNSAARSVAQASFESDNRVKALPEAATGTQSEANAQHAQSAR